MSRVLVGTAAWTDKSLAASGRFYPPKCNSPEDRLRYDYTTNGLVGVAAMTRELSRQAEITQVIFNNNHEDQGQRNGREMINLLAATD